MRSLADSFLQSLVDRLDNENTIGVTLIGSFARGEGGEYSDVDIRCYVRQAPTNEAEIYSMQYQDGFLISIYRTRLEDEYASLGIPQKAIWAVPGLRQSRILLDKDGSIAALQDAAVKFTWEPLQAAAMAHVSWNLSGLAEEIHKILGGLLHHDESMTLNATAGLVYDLTNTILVLHGVLIPTENAFLELAQAAAGWKSNWTRQFRLANALDPLPVGESPYISRGTAGLRLYRETASLLQTILMPEDAAVINRTVEIISEAGY